MHKCKCRNGMDEYKNKTLNTTYCANYSSIHIKAFRWLCFVVLLTLKRPFIQKKYIYSVIIYSFSSRFESELAFLFYILKSKQTHNLQNIIASIRDRPIYISIYRYLSILPLSDIGFVISDSPINAAILWLF